ncbi:PTS sugar transporter subunit IIC [Dielma fastidiosa]|uniref:PTS sugar transporter subunit IIC n=1 Tax=Dielma fastidiosa TaxID=1034346 RepID=UPI001FD51E44|nr:PTS transporter subunit EIIC [Dielma fastidiosa]
MNTLQNVLMKYLMPIANKVEQQKHLQAIKDGMIADIPIVIIGSICLLPIAFMNLLGSGPIYEFLANNISIFTYASLYTNDILSVYAAYFIASALAKRYDMNASRSGITSIAVHLILPGVAIEGGIGIEYLGASGLFTSIVSAILSVEVSRLLLKHHVYIKLPDSVPEMVGESFKTLIPLVINVIVAVIIANLSLAMSGKVFPALVMSLLAPAISSMDSLPALLTVIFFTQLLWFFGLHGPSITSAVWAPFAIAYGAENIANFAAGAPVSHIFTFGLYYNILQVSGSGLTLGLVFLMMKSKSKAFSSMGKVALVPSLFGINEPVIFGLPIILNPYMLIPFVFGPLVITAMTYFVMNTGFIGMPIANPPGFLPPGVGAFLMTLDWRSVIFVFVCLILMTLFYLPFFKTMEAEELKREQASEAANNN